jgi:hypothetical protein
MLFDGDSALKRLPQSVPIEKVMYLDGLRYAAEMVELSYSRLCDGLLAIAREDDEQKHRLLSVQVLHDAWSIIDSADRLRALMWASKIFDAEDMAGFVDCMKGVRDLRNTFQHIDSKIAKLAARQWPVWGSLRWFEWTEPPHVGRFCVLAAGSRVTRRPEPVQEPKPGDSPPGISEVFLASEGVDVSLRAVRENVVLVARALEQGVRDEYSQVTQQASFAADLFICVGVDFRR